MEVTILMVHKCLITIQVRIQDNFTIMETCNLVTSSKLIKISILPKIKFIPNMLISNLTFLLSSKTTNMNGKENKTSRTSSSMAFQEKLSANR